MKLTFLLLIFCISSLANAQTQPPDLSTTILHLDSAFWKAYNQCDTEGAKKFLATDMEFYHDVGGVTYGAEALSESLKKNLCSNDEFRLRREAVAGSVQVYPLKNNGVVYGAIMHGQHVFYIYGKNKPEHLDGLAQFTHVWILKDGTWKMSRILSFDHGPASRLTGK